MCKLTSITTTRPGRRSKPLFYEDLSEGDFFCGHYPRSHRKLTLHEKVMKTRQC